MPVQVQAVGGNRTYDSTLWGVHNFLIQSNQYGFTSFLPSYVNESSGQRQALTNGTDVWLSLRWNHTLAIVERTAAGPNQFVPDESRLRVVPGDRIRAFDAAGRSVNLTIVGVLEQALQFTSGVFVDQSVVRGVFPVQERYTAYFFQMAPGVDVGAFRTDLERTFFVYGLQTIDIREQIGQAFDASQEVLTLMQAYLGIGLLVGIAGLAVITLRAVVERRTQIGALRAIGFTRGMVLATFLVEIALIAVLGIGIGLAAGRIPVPPCGGRRPCAAGDPPSPSPSPHGRRSPRGASSDRSSVRSARSRSTAGRRNPGPSHRSRPPSFIPLSRGISQPGLKPPMGCANRSREAPGTILLWAPRLSTTRRWVNRNSGRRRGSRPTRKTS